MTRSSRGRRALAALVATAAAFTVLTGCTKTVEGTAAKSGTGDVPRNDNSEKQYPNLLKECEVLTEDILDRAFESCFVRDAEEEDATYAPVVTMPGPKAVPAWGQDRRSRCPRWFAALRSSP